MGQSEVDCCIDKSSLVSVQRSGDCSSEPVDVIGGCSKADVTPLCYCFGFTENDIRDEIVESGTTRIPNKIVSLIRDGLCSCASLNPSGLCCLGDVNRVVKKIMADKHGD